MAEYYSKFNGTEIDAAVEKVNSVATKLANSGTAEGNKLVTSGLVKQKFTEYSIVSVHSLDSDGLHIEVYSDYSGAGSGFTSFASFFGVFDELFPYSILRVGGITINNERLISIVPGPEGTYTDPIFIFIDSSNNLIVKTLSDPIFTNKITHSVSKYSRSIT